MPSKPLLTPGKDSLGMPEIPTNVRWLRAVIGAIVLHAGLGVGAMALPDRPKKESDMAFKDSQFEPGATVSITPMVFTQIEPTENPIPHSTESQKPSSLPQTRHSESLERGASPQSIGKVSFDQQKTKPLNPKTPKWEDSQQVSAPSLLHGNRGHAVARSTPPQVDIGLLAGSSNGQAVANAVQDVDNLSNHAGIGMGAVVEGPSKPSDLPKSELVFTRKNDKLMYRDPQGKFTATLHPDGSVDFRNNGVKMTSTRIAVAGLGDALCALAGEDPYARLKNELLKATFDQRLRMAENFQKKQMEKQLSQLRKDLGRIWDDESITLYQRKELIFDRWDENEESAEVSGFGQQKLSDLDKFRQKTGEKARRLIEDFILERAPQGSSEAFTSSELADMNARRMSKQKFQPYQ